MFIVSDRGETFVRTKTGKRWLNVNHLIRSVHAYMKNAENRFTKTNGFSRAWDYTLCAQLYAKDTLVSETQTYQNAKAKAKRRKKRPTNDFFFFFFW